jgi:hypothetical protein
MSDSWDNGGDVRVCTDCYFAHHYGCRPVPIDPVEGDTYTIFAGTGETWTVGENIVTDPGFFTGCIFDDNGDVTARSVHHRDNMVVAVRVVRWQVGDSDDLVDLEPLRNLLDVDLWDNTDSDTGEGIDEFSWSSCDGCGSSLGGSRYRLHWTERTP